MRRLDIGAAAETARRVSHLASEAAATPVRMVRRNSGVLHGLAYRLLRRHPDAAVDDKTLADRIRSTLGPLEKRLDIPRVHVMAAEHVVTLHGDVASQNDAQQIEQAVARVPGVRRVDSKLHVGLLKSDTRPSATPRK